MVETPVCSSVLLGTVRGLRKDRPELPSGAGQGGLPRKSTGPGVRRPGFSSAALAACILPATRPGLSFLVHEREESCL